jgi:hypothetical protein
MCRPPCTVWLNSIPLITIVISSLPSPTCIMPLSPRVKDEPAPCMYFIPFPTPGHALPMSDLARLFASLGADVTLVLTRANAARLGGPVARAAAAGHRIQIHALTLPAEAAGLTGGHESADDLPNRELAGPFAVAVDLLAPLFADLLRRHRPDAVVFDGVLPWAATAAPELGVPRYAFTGTGCFALSVQRALLLHAPQDGAASDAEPFLVPGLPDAVRLTRSRLAEATLPGAHSREFLNRMFDVDRATAGWVVNSFAHLERRNIDHYEKDTGKPVFPVGPVCIVNGDGDDTMERGRGGEDGAAAEFASVLAWLDAKPARSVVYVCFGSLTRFPPEQMSELGAGLADSGANFVWVVGDKNAPPLYDLQPNPCFSSVGCARDKGNRGGASGSGDGATTMGGVLNQRSNNRWGRQVGRTRGQQAGAREAGRVG